jgi:hypothetical protein
MLEKNFYTFMVNLSEFLKKQDDVAEDKYGRSKKVFFVI